MGQVVLRLMKSIRCGRDNQLLVQRYFTLGDYSQWRGVMGLNRNLPKSILINYLVLVKVSVLLEQETI